MLAKKPVVDWFEIISENFMVDGGRPLEFLDSILEHAVPESSQTKIDWADQIQRWFDDWSVLGWFCRPPSLPRQRL
jgi:hypothetical protein